MDALAKTVPDRTGVEPAARERKAWYAILAALIVCIAVARMVSTYTKFTQTFDEPFHIACGMQLLQQGIYTIELQHPPLARLLVALGPYAAGLRSPRGGDAVQLGNGILQAGGRYQRNLLLARLGTLPFFLLACGVVWFWSSRVGGRRAALASLLLFSLLPPVLAHGSLATTDMACAATVCLALFCFVLWMEKPSLRRSLVLGVATGLAVVSKFSALLFLPTCAGALLLLKFAPGPAPHRRFGEIARNLVLASLAAYFVIWAGYLFAMEPITGPPPHPAVERLLHGVPAAKNIVNALLEVRIPAGQLPRSVVELAAHNSGGHTAFFLGEWRKRGWWYFFPVIFLLKTPLPFLLLSVTGAFLLGLRLRARRDWLAAAACLSAVVIMATALFSHISIGSRHILAVYPLLAIVSGYAVCELWSSRIRRGGCRALAAAAVVAMVGSSVLAHPNYLAYFNILASRQPERVEVDSDLDWGQDLGSLVKWLRAHDVREVSVAYFGTADLTSAGLPPFQELQPYLQTSGWVAISAYDRALPSPFTVTRVPGRAAYYAIPPNFDSVPHTEGPFAWIVRYQPVARIGRSIFVYHIDPRKVASAVSGGARFSSSSAGVSRSSGF
jgi:hypothetical protein